MTQDSDVLQKSDCALPLHSTFIIARPDEFATVPSPVTPLRTGVRCLPPDFAPG